jgi:hypothetical protein
MVRQITLTGFPGSWQAAGSEEHTHDSRTYGTRFMRRFDHPTREKLEDLSTHFDEPAAEVIHQLIEQAELADFPKSWHLRAAERRAQRAHQSGAKAHRKLTS